MKNLHKILKTCNRNEIYEKTFTSYYDGSFGTTYFKMLNRGLTSKEFTSCKLPIKAYLLCHNKQLVINIGPWKKNETNIPLSKAYFCYHSFLTLKKIFGNSFKVRNFELMSFAYRFTVSPPLGGVNHGLLYPCQQGLSTRAHLHGYHIIPYGVFERAALYEKTSKLWNALAFSIWNYKISLESKRRKKNGKDHLDIFFFQRKSNFLMGTPAPGLSLWESRRDKQTSKIWAIAPKILNFIFFSQPKAIEFLLANDILNYHSSLIFLRSYWLYIHNHFFCNSKKQKTKKGSPGYPAALRAASKGSPLGTQELGPLYVQTTPYTRLSTLKFKSIRTDFCRFKGSTTSTFPFCPLFFCNFGLREGPRDHILLNPFGARRAQEFKNFNRMYNYLSLRAD